MSSNRLLSLGISATSTRYLSPNELETNTYVPRNQRYIKMEERAFDLAPFGASPKSRTTDTRLDVVYYNSISSSYNSSTTYEPLGTIKYLKDYRGKFISVM